MISIDLHTQKEAFKIDLYLVFAKWSFNDAAILETIFVVEHSPILNMWSVFDDREFVLQKMNATIILMSVYLYVVIATATKRKEIDANWKWIEEHLLPTLGNKIFK